MKKIIFAKIGSSEYEVNTINQFDDVKVEVKEPVYEVKEVFIEVEKEIDGEVVIVQEKQTEQIQIDEKVYYTLPDGTIPENPDVWQSRPDPEIPDGYVLMSVERPDVNYIANEKGKWVIDERYESVQSEILRNNLLDEANSRIEILQDVIDLEMQQSNEDEQLKAWRKYRILLLRVDTSVEKIEWPVKP